MIVFYVCLAIAVVFLVLAIIAAKMGLDTGTAMFGTFFLVLALGISISGVNLINKEAKWNRFIFEYENTKALVATYNGSDYGNMTELTQEMLNINKEIARHRAYNGNKLIGAWYTEKIGALEPLTFNYTNTRTEKEEKIPLPAE